MANLPSYLPSFSPGRIRSYLRSLPVFTRLCLVLILAAVVLAIQNIITWSIIQWGSLIPNEMGFGTMYRMNTYPFINGGLLHAAFNIFAFLPLMERFEAEHGTLVSAAMFFGPFATFPGLLYVGIEKFLIRSNTAVYGTSIWVFLLLSVEAIKLYRSNPYFTLGTNKIPTWISPLVIAVLIAVFIPGTSFVGHLCGCAIGYPFGLGYLRPLQPPERVLRYVESRLNLLGRIPHYVSIDQKTYGRYGVLPMTTSNSPSAGGGASVAMQRQWTGGSERLGP